MQWRSRPPTCPEHDLVPDEEDGVQVALEMRQHVPQIAHDAGVLEHGNDGVHVPCGAPARNNEQGLHGRTVALDLVPAGGSSPLRDAHWRRAAEEAPDEVPDKEVRGPIERCDQPEVGSVAA